MSESGKSCNSGETCNMMHYCLFFTSQAFCRSLNRMAEEEMAPTGLAPSQTYLLMIIIETPGITPKELSEHMQLAPSTVTRFIDKFVARKLVTRESDGKLVKITATEAGRNLSPVIKKVWADLYQRYSNVLGKERGDNLAIQLDAARKDLES